MNLCRPRNTYLGTHVYKHAHRHIHGRIIPTHTRTPKHTRSLSPLLEPQMARKCFLFVFFVWYSFFALCPCYCFLDRLIFEEKEVKGLNKIFNFETLVHNWSNHCPAWFLRRNFTGKFAGNAKLHYARKSRNILLAY